MTKETILHLGSFSSLTAVLPQNCEKVEENEVEVNISREYHIILHSRKFNHVQSFYENG